MKINKPSSGKSLVSIRCKIIRAGSLDSLKSARLAKQAGFNESSEPSYIILHLIESKPLPELGSFIFTSRFEPARLIKRVGTFA